MKGSETMEIIGDLASQQWGLVTSAQAKANGVDLPSLRRLAERGALVRVRHGVYANAAPTLSPELEVKAQWLALRPELMAADRANDPTLAVEAVVSHTTAAEIWGIGDLWPDGIHFTVSDRRRSRQPDIRFHRADLTDTDWTIHPGSGLPVTTVTRTIVDLAQAGHEPGHLLGLVADAGRKSLLSEQGLLDAFSGHEDSFGVDTELQPGPLLNLIGVKTHQESQVHAPRRPSPCTTNTVIQPNSSISPLKRLHTLENKNFLDRTSHQR